MKAKVRKGEELLFISGASNDWSDLKSHMIINFMDRWNFESFKQSKNHLILTTSDGEVDIVFTGGVPELEFESYTKDQLILVIKNNQL